MKTIMHKRFSMSIIFFLVIILLLSVLSAYYLNMLSGKTSAILKENHYSVVYARDMSKNLTNINQRIITYLLTNKNPDSSFINNELMLFDKSLQLEKKNITEPGEDKLAYGIETSFNEYRDSIGKFMKSPKPITEFILMQNKFEGLFQQLMLLSQLNEKAIEAKTQNAKVSAKKSSIQMSIIGVLCFLIAFGYTFSLGSYFNERFFKLYNGIKEMVSSNYNQKLYFDGKDEFYEISLIFNEMADKLRDNNQKMTLTLQSGIEKDYSNKDIQELKKVLYEMKSIEEQAKAIIFRLENKK